MPKKTKTKESEVAPMLVVVHGNTYLHSSEKVGNEGKPEFLGDEGGGVQYFKILIVKKIRPKGSYSILKFGENVIGIHQHLASFSDEEFEDLLPEDKELKERMITVRKQDSFLSREELISLMKIYTASLMGNGEYSFLGTLWHLHKVFDQQITRIKTKELKQKES